MPRIDGSDRERIHALEVEIDRLRAAVDRLIARPAAGSLNVPVRVAKAYAKTGETYPSTGNTFPIMFVDGAFTQAPGDQSPTIVHRQDEPVAYCQNFAGTIPPEDTLLEVFLWGGYWWTQWQEGTAADSTICLVRVNHASASDCASADDDAQCVWPGKKISVNTAGSSMCGDTPYSDNGDVWIAAANHCDSIGSLKQNERYLGMKVGTFNNGGDTRDLIVIIAPVVSGGGGGPTFCCAVASDADDLQMCTYDTGTCVEIYLRPSSITGFDDTKKQLLGWNPTSGYWEWFDVETCP